MTTQTEALKLAQQKLVAATHHDAHPHAKETLALEALQLVTDALAQPEQELDYKAIGQQAYESGYSTGYMDCAVKMKAQPEQDWIERERAVGYREGHQNALKQMSQPEQKPVAWLQFKENEPPVVVPRDLGTPVFLGIRGGLAHDTQLKEKNT